MLGSVAIASTVGGAMNSKKDRICLTLVVGSVFMVIGTACLSTLSNVVALEPNMFGFQVFVGLGFGLMVSTVSLGASLESEKRDSSESFPYLLIPSY
jgi:dipeptide/tripeptide permease